MKITLATVVIFFLGINPGKLSAQDTEPILTDTLSAIVVTANKFENRLLNTTSSMSTITNNEIGNYSVNNLADVLQLLPGIQVYNTDGLGRSPIVSARGFYGGGEAEYLTVMVDGMTLNDFETGLVNWNFIPLSNIEKIEVLRGGASSLYGDAAMGGVINITTGKQDTVNNSIKLTGGSYGTLNGTIARSANIGENRYQLYLSNERTNGFRDHSSWKATSFGGKISIPINNSAKFRIATNNQYLTEDEPGALTRQEEDKSKTTSSPYYKSDRKDETRITGSVDFIKDFSSTSELNLLLQIKHKNSNNNRTFTDTAPIIDPATFRPVAVYDTTLFGDTKERELTVNDGRLSGRFYKNFEGLNTRSVAGADVSYGDYSNKFYSVFNGFKIDYTNADLSRGSLVSKGDGNRAQFSAYINNEISIIEPIKFVVGVRYDKINDHFDNIFPADSTIEAENSALTSKIGLNVKYADIQNYQGSIYVNYNTSFKSPTVDQLTALKPLDFGLFIPAGPNEYFFTTNQFPPFANTDLKPQRSRNFEMGTYQLVRISSDFFGELFLSAYQTDIEDEIDFDLQTFRYQNISESRHTGIESGLKLTYRGNWRAFFNYTYSLVKFRSGRYEGNRLKALPKKVFSFGISYDRLQGFHAATSFTSINDIYLDDENTVKLPNYYYADLQVGYKINSFNLFVDVNNIFDGKYSTTGYLLNGTEFYYPASGRVVKGGIDIEF